MDGQLDQRRYLIPFRSSLLPQIFTGTLVIGAGVAGLRAAIAAGEQGDAIVLAKGTLDTSNTAWAQGGIAVTLDPTDTPDAHIADTLSAGAGLCDEPVVRSVVQGGPEAIAQLIAWGMRLDQSGDKPALGREGGHSAPRIVHSDGDATGAELQRVLIERARRAGNIRLFDRCFALDLITVSGEPGSPVLGAITHHPRYGLQVIWAGATILATGGAGVLYRETSNPTIATGDGLAMAYRAGATLSDMAFVQFHPTTLYLAGASRALITEAIRGAGAHLLDAGERRFMPEVHPLAELAPRDVVSRAIVRQIANQGGAHVWLDCRHVADFESRFPGIASLLRRFDLNAGKDLIPVHPAAHYMGGGVRAGVDGETDVPGLYAVGEAASTGLHGANRLASNSLLEGLVLGERVGNVAGRAARAGNGTARHGPVGVVSDIRPSDRGELDLADVRSSLRSAMWRNVGIERTASRLEGVADMIDFWARYTLDKIFDDPAGWETQNMLLAASLVVRSAAWRTESRGCHTRSDFPDVNPALRVHDLWRRGDETPRTAPVQEVKA
ncbi:MAG: L-aspartate oxidase [Phycisphaerales bacterium]|nr:L-aspartate oxidase [Phycisphaerales bacterium]